MDSTAKHPVSKNQVRKPNLPARRAPRAPRAPRASRTRNGVVGVEDPHGGGVGDSGHARLLPLLLVPVNDEERQEEEDHQHQDDDARDGPDLVGVGGQGRAGSAQAVQVPNYYDTG